MNYCAEPSDETGERIDFETLEEVRQAGTDLGGYDVTYTGSDPVVCDLFRILSPARGTEEAIEVIETSTHEERVVLMYRLQRQGWDPSGEFPLPLTFEGRIVLDSREVERGHEKKVGSEADAINFFLRELIEIEDYRGILLKRDFWRFFDYKGFLKHREIVSFENAGVFYVLMLHPHNHK